MLDEDILDEGADGAHGLAIEGCEGIQGGLCRY